MNYVSTHFYNNQPLSRLSFDPANECQSGVVIDRNNLVPRAHLYDLSESKTLNLQVRSGMESREILRNTYDCNRPIPEAYRRNKITKNTPFSITKVCQISPFDKLINCKSRNDIYNFFKLENKPDSTNPFIKPQANTIKH